MKSSNKFYGWLAAIWAAIYSGTIYYKIIYIIVMSKYENDLYQSAVPVALKLIWFPVTCLFIGTIFLIASLLINDKFYRLVSLCIYCFTTILFLTNTITAHTYAYIYPLIPTILTAISYFLISKETIKHR